MEKKDYKLAYDYIYNLINLDDESMKWPLTIDSMAIFKELVDEKLNKPTFEEVKQEWEEFGYTFKNLGYKIEISKECVKDEINDSYTVFVKWINIFTKAQQYNSNYLFTYKEHQLLTKTFKALGWE